MGLLEDQIQSDATQAFLDADGFAETVVYVPITGPERTIAAIVRRETPEMQMGTKQDVQPHVLVIVANDSVLGISSSEINYGGDKLRLPYRIGQTADTHTIKQPKQGQETNDPGCLSLEI